MTPPEYEPPNFRSSEFSEFNYLNGRVEFPIGRLNSVWHVVNFTANVSQTQVRDSDEFTMAAPQLLTSESESQKEQGVSERSDGGKPPMKVNLKDMGRIIRPLAKQHAFDNSLSDSSNQQLDDVTTSVQDLTFHPSSNEEDQHALIQDENFSSASTQSS